MEAPTAHRNAPSEHSGVPHGLFGSDSAPRCLLRNAHASGSLRSPSGGRTEMLLRNIPVFRSAFFRKGHAMACSPKRSTFRFASLTLRLRTITPCGALVFRSAYWLRQTLDLQVRFAHPPMGGGSSAPPLAPHRNAPSEHSGVPHGLFMISHHRPCGRWCFARLIRQAETLELQLHSQPPSKRTALSPPKRSCFRFASLALRLRTEPALRAAPVFRSAFFRKGHAMAFSPKRSTFRFASLTLRLRTITPCGALVFRSAYWLRQTLDLQVRFAHPPMSGGSFAPPCTPLSCPRKCGDRQAAIPLCGKSSLSEHAMDFPSALHIPKEAWSFLRTPPRPAAKRAAATRAATPLPPPGLFLLSYRSFFFSYFS